MPPMSNFSFHFLRFDRFRSRSPRHPRNDTSVSHSPESSRSALSLRPPSEQASNAAYRLSASGRPVGPQNPEGRLSIDRAQDQFDGQNDSVDVDSTAQQPTRLSSPSGPTGFAPAETAAYTLTTSPPQSLSTEPPSVRGLEEVHSQRSSGRCSPQPQNHNGGMFKDSKHFAMTNPAFFDNNQAPVMINNNITSSPFMKDLLEGTIPGAEHDSSQRYPPPRCHAETRSAILEHCLYFISHCNGVKRIRWVVGLAGVGKSAIMQSVAESPVLLETLQASVFFSVIGRNDGTRAVKTISYQLAAKSEVYCQTIEQYVTRDPSLLQSSSIAKQFKKFIIEPFIHNSALKSAGRVLVLIDGLDECAGPLMQQEILRLISDLCIEHPSSPFVWLIASRPEKHITSFFSRPRVIPTYEKEEVPVDSDQARADVERYLDDKLTEIQQASQALGPEWPAKEDFRKLADAAGGLFAYANAVVRYIGDSTIDNPALQLSEVLLIIDEHPITDMPPDEHPLALLDALYNRILSDYDVKENKENKENVKNTKNKKNMQKLLLALASRWDHCLSGVGGNFIVLCNWLGMTRDEAYAAVSRLSSVLLVPPREEADHDPLRPFHKSLIDYISDPLRSKKFPPSVRDEFQRFKTECTFRILKGAQDGVNFSNMDYNFPYGALSRGPGSGSEISLSWPVQKPGDGNDDATRLALYKLAVGEVVAGIRRGDPDFKNEFCARLLTSRFQRYSDDFPRYQLCELAFDESRRILPGILKETFLGFVRASELDKYHMQFLCPANTTAPGSNPWNASCQHERDDILGDGKGQRWTTKFHDPRCSSCFQRLERQLQIWNSQSPGHVAPVLHTSTEECCIEFQSDDLKDCMSHWVWIRLATMERRTYGNLV